MKSVPKKGDERPAKLLKNGLFPHALRLRIWSPRGGRSSSLLIRTSRRWPCALACHFLSHAIRDSRIRFRCYNVGTHFDLVRLSLRFTALDSIHFTPGHAANLLRGAFGLALESADYARLFAPRAGSGPSGLAESPRPFVFRARHLDGLTFRPGQSFHFDLNVFLDQPAALEAIHTAFAAAAAAGIGPGRGRAEMQAPSARRVSLALDPAPYAATRIRVDFLSPSS